MQNPELSVILTLPIPGFLISGLNVLRPVLLCVIIDPNQWEEPT